MSGIQTISFIPIYVGTQYTWKGKFSGNILNFLVLPIMKLYTDTVSSFLKSINCRICLII